jgi:hypothetical protein
MNELEYHLVYHDKKGKRFEHQVKIRKVDCEGKEYKLISLGGGGEHYWDEIVGFYPYQKGSEFVINFSQQKVITGKEMNKIIEFFKDKWVY